MKKKIKKVPTTLFGMELEHNAYAHRFSVAMAMVGLTTDIQSADLIIRLFGKLEEVSDDFNISDAINLRNEVTEEYAAIKEKFNKLTPKKK